MESVTLKKCKKLKYTLIVKNDETKYPQVFNGNCTEKKVNEFLKESKCNCVIL